MNDPALGSHFDDWFPLMLVIIAVVQTGLLALLCWLMCEWFSKLNRKLHRIESNTRHTAEAMTPDGQEAV